MSNLQIDLEYLRRMGAVTFVSGREYLTHNGLVRVAHEAGLKSLEGECIHADFPAKSFAFRVVASGERGTFTGHGDACPANVAKHLREACLRMAETRAISRALRLYTGLGMTVADELPEQGDEGALGASVVVERADVIDADFEQAPERRALPEPDPDAHGEDLKRQATSKAALREPVMVDASGQCCACGRLVPRDAPSEGDLRFCDEHFEIWNQPADPGYDETTFRIDLGDAVHDFAALDLRCLASPQWGKRPRAMTDGERARLTKVLVEHAERKRAREGKP